MVTESDADAVVESGSFAASSASESYTSARSASIELIEILFPGNDCSHLRHLMLPDCTCQ